MPTLLDGFEVTPVVEHAVELFFVHLYPTYPLLSRETVSTWLKGPETLSKSEQVLLWSVCAATLMMVSSFGINIGSTVGSPRCCKMGMLRCRSTHWLERHFQFGDRP